MGICAYDGTDFDGWQSQISRNGVQDVLEDRLFAIFGHLVRVHGSSRTDAGVHAERQGFHFDANWKHDDVSLLRALDFTLRRDLCVTSLVPVPSTFHARFSVVQKCYRYDISWQTSPFHTRYCWTLRDLCTFDLGAAQRCAELFLGEHNFSAFAGHVDNGENPVKRIDRCEIAADERGWSIRIAGNGFLYRMARILVGAILASGRRKIDLLSLQHMLADGTKHVPLAAVPAKGLFLENICYSCFSKY
jgi:tRNA pseudouridine38-40 synthase